MTPSGCTITSFLQPWSPYGCCNFVAFLIRYGPSHSLICFCLRVLSLQVPPFRCPFYPRTCVASTRDLVAGWYPVVHVSVFSSGVTFSGAPLPTPVRPKHEDSVDGWYSAVHMSVFSSDVTFPVLHFPRLLRLKRRDSVAGWYPAVQVFSSPVRVLPFMEPLPSFSAFPCTSTFCPAR